jgi:hypothetical protein
MARMTLMRGNLGGYEFNRMVMLFSMMDGPTEIPCAVSATAMDEIEQVSDYESASSNVPRGNSSRASSKVIRPASFCAASTFGRELKICRSRRLVESRE